MSDDDDDDDEARGVCEPTQPFVVESPLPRRLRRVEKEEEEEAPYAEVVVGVGTETERPTRDARDELAVFTARAEEEVSPTPPPRSECSSRALSSSSY